MPLSHGQAGFNCSTNHSYKSESVSVEKGVGKPLPFAGSPAHTRPGPHSLKRRAGRVPGWEQHKPDRNFWVPPEPPSCSKKMHLLEISAKVKHN